MASQGYYEWVAAGRPYALIRPVAKTQANIRRHGITVYDYPDESHLKADPPEDHTSFSETGWPGPNARWKARGIDIMPRADTEEARDENTAIAIQMIHDRDTGYPGAQWIKYINYTDDDGKCWHVKWQPNKVVTSSTDSGHVHASGRSDVDNDTRADDYDPVARMNGEEEDMEKTNLIGNTATSAKPGGRNVEDILGDLENKRNIEYGEIKKGDGRFPADNTPLAAALAIPAKVDAVTQLVTALTQAVNDLKEQVANITGGDVSEATVIAALKSPEGQAAISTAVEYAEDH